MCKIDPTVKKWFDLVNDMGQDISYHARDEYDTFLEKCLEPYGIDKINAALMADRVRIEEENQHINGFETVSYQRFYFDGVYWFTVVFKQKPVATGGFISGTIITYEKVVEEDLTKEEGFMPNAEAINILTGLMNSTPESAISRRDKALKMAIEALREQTMVRNELVKLNERLKEIREMIR